MEAVFGRHQGEIRSVSGIYGSADEGDNEFAAIRGDGEGFAREEGRRRYRQAAHPINKNFLALAGPRMGASSQGRGGFNSTGGVVGARADSLSPNAPRKYREKIPRSDILFQFGCTFVGNFMRELARHNVIALCEIALALGVSNLELFKPER